MNKPLDTHPLTGSFWKDNYVWAIGMQLCWNQLYNDFLHGPIQLKKEGQKAQKLASLFNLRRFDQSAVSPKSVYANAGFGPQLIKAIQEDLARDFPNRTTDTLSGLTPGLMDLICFSYLYKNFQHHSRFKEIEMLFLGSKVKGFAPEVSGSPGIELLDYDDDDNFVLRLLSKSGQDEIVLIKGNETARMEDILQFLSGTMRGSTPAAADTIQIPNITLEVDREYHELLGGRLVAEGNELDNYVLTGMEEQIRLSLNYLGATVENEAVMAFARGGVANPKRLVFDQPFWLVLKETQSPQPYLMLKVNNTAVLEKKIS
ncbi:MAG: hypothetical protein KTR30_21600 [Saprospiraceae bacterium]|nr:hypothetical protein [Saprospiraceae bacterium]